MPPLGPVSDTLVTPNQPVHVRVHKLKFAVPPPHDATAPVGQGLRITEASRSHSDTPHSVGLLWTSDRPVAETST
jgi:hypothetical protein